MFMERGFLMLRGHQAGRELRAQSAEAFSLFVRSSVTNYSSLQTDQYAVHLFSACVPLSHFVSQNKQFAIKMDDMFTVHYGTKRLSTDYTKMIYRRYYMGGLPTQLRLR